MEWRTAQRAERLRQEGDGVLQCDHLGTPQELTDHEGSIAWSAQHKAWGEARETISEAGRRAGFRNPIRFQGQYFDEETGLHYNRYRYFDPHSGRFLSTDPIRLKGGVNLQLFAPNPIEWVDPLGLVRQSKANRYHGPKPKYDDPGHHDSKSPNFRGGGSGKTSLIPCNASELFKGAIPDREGKHWYALNEQGVVHRFGNSNDGKAHWNGDSSQGRGIVMPPEVQKRIDSMQKDGVHSLRRCEIGK